MGGPLQHTIVQSLKKPRAGGCTKIHEFRLNKPAEHWHENHATEVFFIITVFCSTDRKQALHAGSRFLPDFRETAASRTRGCILMDAPEALLELVERHDACDSSGRGTARAELAAMAAHPSHDQPGGELPETSFAYRFAKKHWFFGFGAYG